ncbi:endonuclease/exonuclease/phosphatase family protein [candidate division KSB1 bacterium]|nr:MAG: endonuclease/exonuclease/phosphatase family protein [candidate division KSB1 bacterium]
MKLIIIIAIIMGALVTGCENSTPTIRAATFNIWEMSTQKLHHVDENGAGLDEQIRAAAAIIQKVRPDILVINEIDHDYDFPDDLAKNARQFRDAYLNRSAAALDYPYVFAAPCNTGIRAGFDFDNDGVIADSTHEGTRLHGVDCYGYGAYPGQYSMALLSRFPIDSAQVRTFQKFLWRDLPDNHIPSGFYSKEELAVFRLSSKSHWDVPVHIDGKTLHLFLSHPTPPAFDGPEDRNGRRNFDEIKFWVNYIKNDAALYDDNGVRGGYSQNEPFLIAGDMNAAPDAPPAYDGINAVSQLLSLPNLQDPFAGAEPLYTAQFGDSPPMRIDYLLPSAGIDVVDQGVFWPAEQADKAGFELAEKASDHRLVWIDIKY